MVPKLHAKGTSFKGAAAYLLHDKGGASTSERVAWVETRNLAVEDPELAWRIMAATALDQARLKAEAGVKATGRKSDKHVLHLSLAWHPEQQPSREEMIAAADGALKALGAGDRQAMLVAHDDEEHAHLHVLINRVSPENGKHLTTSNDRLKLSKWAEAYEREGGRIYCEDRVINNAMRAKGEYVKGPRDVARHLFEAQRAQAANDNDQGRAEIARQKALDHALALRGRNMAALHAQAWARLEQDHKARKAALGRRLAREIAEARIEAREALRPEWRALHREQESERKTFDELERSLFGRAGNIARTVRLSADDIGGERTGVIARSFRILTNAGARRDYFEKAQERVRTALERRQAAKVAEAAAERREAYSGRQAALRGSYEAARQDLAQRQDGERATLRDAWKVRTAEREAGLERTARLAERRGEAKADHARAAKRSDDSDPRAAALERYARQVEFQKAAREASQEQDNERGRDLDQADD
jgi:hypothetical protein